MYRRNLRLASAAIVTLSMAGATILSPVPKACAQAKRQISYAQDVAPIFRGWCVSCHAAGGEGFKASGLDLTTYQGLMKGTKFGRMVIPGQPDVSNLVVLIEGRAAPQLRMPHGESPLPECLRQEIWSWVFQGAKDN
jgi:Planctomycete cytochrome C